MFKISWKIEIEGKALALLDSVEIRTSIDNLTDSATIKLPQCVFNNNLSELESIKKGQTVQIWLGYDNNLEEEFHGYISEVSADGEIVIECQNEIYLFNAKTLPDKVFTKPKLKELLKYVVDNCAPKMELNCQYDFSYDKFTISTATGLDVLKLVQDECHCMIFIKDDKLNITAPYVQAGKSATVTYDLSKNVMAEGFSLKYKDKSDRKLKVTAKGKGADGKEIKEEGGEGGGDTLTIDYKGIATKELLKKQIAAVLEQKSYSGYEGEFQGWGLPVVRKCDAVQLIDPTDSKHNGKYFVNGVTTTCGSGGFTRKISLGKTLG